MDRAYQEFHEDQYPAVFHAPDGEGICGTAVRQGFIVAFSKRGRIKEKGSVLPEINVTELSEMLKTQDKFILLDVREMYELNYAKLTDSRLEIAPLSHLAREGTNALSDSAKSKDSTIYVMCHHGNRSAQVTAWLAQQGWKNVFNVRGGIDEYASKVDPSIGFY
jgi:rhodanese-related sulfurtransferase